MREIYDVITKQTISLEKDIKKIGSSLGVDYTALCHLLSKKQLHAFGRYILPENKDKIFTLVDYDSNIEYDCIANKTIFLYFNLPINKNEIKYIYELRRKRQAISSICNRLFYLKGSEKIFKKRGGIKNISQKVIAEQNEKQLKIKLKNSIMGRIHSALKSKKLKKLNRTEQMIGCSIDFLKGYIENQFSKNMNWNNKGDWHLDHIIPVNLFNLENEIELQKCFHYTNLRPLWATTEIAIKYGETKEYIGNLNRERYNENNLPLEQET